MSVTYNSSEIENNGDVIALGVSDTGVDISGSIVDSNLKEKLEGKTYSNLVKNPHFVSFSSWLTQYALIEVADNICTATGNGGDGRMSVLQHFQGSVGDIIYIKSDILVMNSECSALRITTSGGTYPDPSTGQILSPTENVDYHLSGFFTITSDNGLVYFYISAYYPTGVIQLGKIMKVGTSGGTIAYNLTQLGLASTITTTKQAKAYFNFVDGTSSVLPEIVETTGKNLFDKSRVTPGYYINNVPFAANSAFNVSDYILINPTKRHFLSGVTATVSTGLTSIGYFDAVKTFISYQLYNNFSFWYLTIPSNAKFIVFTLFDKDFDTAQLEQSPAPTPYVPFSSTTSTCPVPLKSLPNGVKDSYNVSTGVHVKNVKKYVLTEDDINNLDTSGTNIDYANIPVANLIGVKGTLGYTTGTILIFDTSQTILPYDDITKVNKYILGSSSLIFLFAKGTYLTLAEAKTALAGTVIYYQLATPVITQYPPQIIPIVSGSQQTLTPGIMDSFETDASGNIDLGYELESIDYCFNYLTGLEETAFTITGSTVTITGITAVTPVYIECTFGNSTNATVITQVATSRVPGIATDDVAVLKEDSKEASARKNIVLENLIENGDFSDESFGWTGTGVSRDTTEYHSNSRCLKIEGDATKGEVIARCNSTFKYSMMDKVCIACWIKSERAATNVSQFFTQDSQYFNISVPRANTWILSVSIFEAHFGVFSSPRFRMDNNCDYTNSNLWADDFQLFDLTTSFGAGNEPSADEMKSILDKVGYFSGKKEITPDFFWHMKYEGLTATNLCENGDFRDGTLHWGTESGDLVTLTDSIVRVTGSGLRAYIAIRHDSGDFPEGEVLYGSTTARVVTEGCTCLKFQWRTSGLVAFTEIPYPEPGVWYSLQNIASSYGLFEGPYLRVLAEYPDSLSSSGGELELDRNFGMKVIDLTQTFGSGNEPSLNQCKVLFPRYWEGTQSVVGSNRLIYNLLDNFHVQNNTCFVAGGEGVLEGKFLSPIMPVVEGATYGEEPFLENVIFYDEHGDILPQEIEFIVEAGEEFQMEWTNSDGRLWTFPEGTKVHGTETIIESSEYALVYVDIVNPGVVKLESDNLRGVYSLDNHYKGMAILLELSSVSNLTYYLRFGDCPLVTGDLSSVSNLTNYLDLYNCSLVTGDLCSVSNLTNYLRLGNCSLVTGDLSSVSNLTNYLILDYCSLVTGDLSSVSNLTSYLGLTNCSLVTGDLSSVSNLTYLLRLYNCSLVTGAIPNPSVTNFKAYNVALLGCTGIDVADSIVNMASYWSGKTATAGAYLNLGALQAEYDVSVEVAQLVAAGFTVTYTPYSV